MKTRKHGNGLDHNAVIKFSNRLAYQGVKRHKSDNVRTDTWDAGWTAACKYFAHELRKLLRNFEENNSYSKKVTK